MARTPLSEKVLERANHIEQALEDLGRITDPLTAFLLSQVAIDVNAIRDLCWDTQHSGPGPSRSERIRANLRLQAESSDPVPPLPKPRRSTPTKGVKG